jgi:hypothetical protein
MPTQTHTLSFTSLGTDHVGFNVSSDLGPVTPSYVSRNGLLSGFSFTLDLFASTVTFTPTGPCSEPVTVNLPKIYGCMDPSSITYNPNANTDDGSCVYLDCNFGNGSATLQEPEQPVPDCNFGNHTAVLQQPDPDPGPDPGPVINCNFGTGTAVYQQLTPPDPVPVVNCTFGTGTATLI